MECLKYVQIGMAEWNCCLEQLKACPFNYTAQKIAFDVEYSKKNIVNESFLVKEGKKILAAVVLYVEEINNQKQISWNGGYCPGIYIDRTLSYKQQEKYLKKIMCYVDELAEQYQCSEIWLRMDPLSNPEQKSILYNYNFLLKYNYIDNSSLTQMIDLSQQLEVLYSDIRKGHKSDIKKGQKYQFELYDKTNIRQEQIELYRQIYEEDAGGVNRNSELYLHYYKFIQDGLAVLLLAKNADIYVAAMIVTLYHGTAYYSSYGELTEKLEGIPVGHMMQWKMIQYLKEMGIKSYEIGEQVYGKTHYSCPDKKLMDISNYKRGFGGYTVPFWRGRKYMEAR